MQEAQPAQPSGAVNTDPKDSQTAQDQAITDVESKPTPNPVALEASKHDVGIPYAINILVSRIATDKKALRQMPVLPGFDLKHANKKT